MEIEAGDIVRTTINRTPMMVKRVSDFGIVECWWFDTHNQLQKELFPPHFLRRLGGPDTMVD